MMDNRQETMTQTERLTFIYSKQILAILFVDANKYPVRQSYKGIIISE